MRTTARLTATLLAASLAAALPSASPAGGLAARFAPNSVRVSHYLNFDVALPTPDEAVTPDAAMATVADHAALITGGKVQTSEAMAEYWRDYAAVLSKWTEPTSAKPVFYTTKDGTRLVARYLVGLRRGDVVGGFFTVDSRTGAIDAELMWTPELDPLWQVQAAVWDAAASANDVDEVAELIPPLDQFTSGIPVDPRDPAWTMVDGFVDAMPPKTQEERRAQVDAFNESNGTALGVTLKASLVRRIATLKCMSVAASYAADWWSVRSGRTLGSYKNAVGGQKEYGQNPRVVEAMFFQRRAEVSLFERLVGNWKTAPVAHDPVTGESVPFSPRGICRVLAETHQGTVADPLVPTLLQYETRDHHFGMDQKPVISQVFTEGLFPEMTKTRDLARVEKGEFPFSLAPGYGEPMTPERLARALDTWGPHLAQHMQRTFGGASRTGFTGMGVHCCLIVGHGTYEGKPHFVYRETFGGAGPGYLEDYFLGPEYRIMPAEYFYQAIAFPHHLYLKLSEVRTDLDAALVGILNVTTNGGLDPVDPDQFRVVVDGQETPHARLTRLSPGQFRLWLPIGSTAHAERIEIRAQAKYFADAQGRPWFGVALDRPDGRKWAVSDEPFEPQAE